MELVSEEKSNHNSNSIGVRSVLGVHSACYDIRTVPDDPFCVDIILSTHIVRWNMQKQQRVRTFPLHEALISSIQTYVNASTKQHLTATCSYDGLLKIWDTDYNLLCQTKASESAPLSRIDWSKDGTQLIVHIKATESSFKDCTIALYRLKSDADAVQTSYSLEFVTKKVDNYRYAVFNAHDQVLAFNTDPNVIELLSANALRFIGAFTHCLLRNWSVALAINRARTRLAVATTSKEILIVDASTLELLQTIQHKELSPNIWCLVWNVDNDEEEIIFSPKNGALEVWNAVKAERVYECPAPLDFMYVVQQTMVDEQPFVWLVGSDSIYLQCMTKPIANGDNNLTEQKRDESAAHKLYVENIHKSRRTLRAHSITCCGVDMSFNAQGASEYIAVGDLGCSLCVWSTENASPLVTKTCPMSVRSVKWIPHTDIIIVGCLDGSLCCYRFDRNDEDSSTVLPVLYHCESGGVTCIEYQQQYAATCNKYRRIDHGDDTQQLVFSVGTTGGYMLVFALLVNENRVQLLHRWLAHPPVQSEDAEYKKKFGSIHKAADIWTCVYSPCARYLATASEDQSTKIWDTQNNAYTLVQTLTGHSTAVTCIDWTLLRDGKAELFATCADDRTVMVWKPQKKKSNNQAMENEELELTLLHTFDATSNVLGWFTFTYLRFQRDANTLACGTENGYVCIFDMDKMQPIYTKCVHRGSIEGLECNKNGMLVTVASDCSIVVLQIANTNNKQSLL